MKCTSCGAAMPADARFCANCGSTNSTDAVMSSASMPAPSDKPCPSCGARLPLDAAFCGECGARLSGLDGAMGGATHPPQAATHSPQAGTPSAGGLLLGRLTPLDGVVLATGLVGFIAFLVAGSPAGLLAVALAFLLLAGIVIAMKLLDAPVSNAAKFVAVFGSVAAVAALAGVIKSVAGGEGSLTIVAALFLLIAAGVAAAVGFLMPRGPSEAVPQTPSEQSTAGFASVDRPTSQAAPSLPPVVAPAQAHPPSVQ